MERAGVLILGSGSRTIVFKVTEMPVLVEPTTPCSPEISPVQVKFAYVESYFFLLAPFMRLFPLVALQ